MANPASSIEFEACARRMGETFGVVLGLQIMRIFLEELGGLRLTIPTIKDLAIMDRNRRIRMKFNGANYEELGEMWGLSVRQVRRIVHR